MQTNRILTVQDISCVGQCSLTVALPVLSACGVETAILPTAVLSTHSGGFTGYTYRDLTEDIPAIWRHWKEEGVVFSAIYTGYLGSVRLMDYLGELFDQVKTPEGKIVIDPAMADNGKLYAGFDGAYAAAMTDFCRRADLLLPNLTEACLLTGTPYQESFSGMEIRELLWKLHDLCGGSVVLSGVSLEPGMTGFGMWEDGKIRFYAHKKIPGGYHGTGDLFAAALVGSWIKGKSLYDAGALAANFVAAAIENTKQDPDHWYGVKFEGVLPRLMEA